MAVRSRITFLSEQNINITQLVDTNDGVHVMCPKDMFTRSH